jgi:glucose/arabinose dehydrogenase
MVRASSPKVWSLVMAGMVAAIAVVALLSWKAEPTQSAATVPQGFTDTLIAQMNNPTAMAIAPDGRLFVAQKANNNVGKLRVIKNNQLLSKPFLKVSTDTSFFRGLLGVTLDPNFSSNRYVYVFYTATNPMVHNRVSRFTANGDVAVAGSEKVILDLPPLSTASGHYGGALRFGPDGKLYVGVGDDTTPANAQSLSSRNGKILRINSDGTIPINNPFFGGATSADDAVWALGLRQPYSLDVLSGTSPKMFVNEVARTAGRRSTRWHRGRITDGRPTKASWLRQTLPSITTETHFSPTHTTPPPTRAARSPGVLSTTRPRCASPLSTRAITSTPTTAADGSGAWTSLRERAAPSRAG